MLNLTINDMMAKLFYLMLHPVKKTLLSQDIILKNFSAQGAFMQTSTPLTPKSARQIALRQGLLFGTFAGCLALLGSACSRFMPVASFGFSFQFIYALAFIAFFVAGWRTAKRTGRIDMGALAGFWAGVAVAILGVVTIGVLLFGGYGSGEMRLAEIVRSAFSVLPTALLALLFGPAIGALGGFIGKTYAENSATQPAQPSPTAAQPTAPAQPPPPPPNQP